MKPLNNPSRPGAALTLFVAIATLHAPLAAQEPIPLFDEAEIASAGTPPEHTAQQVAPPRHIDASWATSYSPRPDDLLAEIARDKGMGKGTLKALMRPSTPNAIRIMLLDAAIKEQAASEVAARLLRAMRAMRGEGEALTLDNLKQEELLMLGYLAARASKEMGPLGGEDEVERLSALVLLAAAASRRRGDLTTRVVLAQVKAQRGVDEPDEALCSVRQCLVEAVRPFAGEWSVEPAFVCGLVSSAAEQGPVIRSSEDPLAFCGGPQVEPPMFVEQADQEERERQAAIHNASPPGGGGAGGGPIISILPAGGGASGIPVGGLPQQALRDQLAMIDLAIAEIERERAKLGAGSMEAALFDEMLREIKRQRSLLYSQIQGAAP